jgi:hypothetical protein
LRGVASAHQFKGVNAGNGMSASQLIPSLGESAAFRPRAMSYSSARQQPRLVSIARTDAPRVALAQVTVLAKRKDADIAARA